MTRVLFAPDWRSGVPYQKLLAEALPEHGIEVHFLAGYRRGFPLWRALKKARVDLLHLHWPEAYYPRRGDSLDWFRRARFSTDLALATRRIPLILTAHNLHTHNHSQAAFEHRNTRAAMHRAAAVIAHSEAAKARLIETFGIPAQGCHVVPHGDLSVSLGAPVRRETARAALRLSTEKQCLVFGAVEPYKGIEELIEFWRGQPAAMTLVIAGQPISDAYRAEIEKHAAGLPNVAFHLRRLTDEELRLWLSAADCVLFNYRTIFTSGAACLARSWGVPILIPSRLATVDLEEPHPLVFRFERENLAGKLRDALETTPDFAAADDWRERTAWSRVAAATAAVYRAALSRVAQTSLTA